MKQTSTSREVKKVVAHVVPADFTLQLSIDTGSRKYTWKNTRLWYALETVVWLNALTHQQIEDPNPLTKDGFSQTAYSFRGAFPIVAWVGGYQDWLWKDSQISRDIGGRNVRLLVDTQRMRFY